LVSALGITAAIKQFILGRFLPIRLLDPLFVGITYYPELWKMVKSKLKK
jgi:hypothetical protein